MKVKELIELLKGYDQELEVIYSLHSEHVLLENRDVYVEEHCLERPDGWIQSKRPDKPFKKYLVV